jgi:hypothetical protein
LARIDGNEVDPPSMSVEACHHGAGDLELSREREVEVEVAWDGMEMVLR